MTGQEENKPYGLGLALSGGGAKGFAHVGVFQYLEHCKITPEIIAGTSAGALMGAFYADGYSPKEICQLFVDRDFMDFAELQIPKAGLLDASKMKAFLSANLRTKNIEDLKTPLVIIATDLDNGCSHEFRTGSIVDAVMASCSIPILFNPVEINGTHYVDGGVFQNFPVSAIREECERIIGVNVSPLIPQDYKQTIFNIAERSYHYLFRANTLEDRELCDILIEAEEFAMYKTFDLENTYKIVQTGYDAADATFKQFLTSCEDNYFKKQLSQTTLTEKNTL